MKTIWKYDLPFRDSISLQVPVGAIPLTVMQDQKDMMPRIWMLVDTEQPKETRSFELFGTGNPIHCDMGIERKYIGTYQYQGGEFVGHIFERIQ